jgi:lon-related putative ATP-dependent protease
MPEPLPIEDVEWVPPIGLSFQTSDELAPLPEIIGQRRALAAMTLGLDMSADGYNLFVMGDQGSGRRRLVRQLLDEAAAKRAPPDDWCYVDNFADQRSPKAIRLPRGMGQRFRDRMSGFVSNLQEAFRTAFQSEDYRTLQQVIEEGFREQNERAIQEVEEKAKAAGLAMVRAPTGIAFAPLNDGQIIQPDAFQQLPEEQREAITANMKRMESELQRALRQVPTWAFSAREKMRELNQRTAAYALDFLLDGVKRDFSDVVPIQLYLTELRADVLENVDLIISALGAPKANSIDELINGHPFYRRYLVNLIVDNSALTAAPVVFEDDPTLDRLLGAIEHRAEMGTLQTDLHLIRPGALHRANGGYLILDARKLLTAAGSWESLKRSLYAHQIRIENAAQALGIISTVSLKPDPIRLDIKLVLIGDRRIYYLLADADPEFAQLFKIAVDWEDSVKLDNGDGDRYVRLVAAIASESRLKPFTRSAVSQVLHYAARQTGDRERYTMQLTKVRDLMQESAYFAGQRGAVNVDAQDVRQAVRAQIDRLGRIPELVRETIEQGVVLIETETAVVGQINGLSVSQIGALSFGRPSRITARIGLGRGEFVDIEREVEMGGPIHSKGVLILASFLRSTFGAAQPLSLRASLVFEQSYGGVDGDSASVAETCALISAIAQVPIDQHFAITGSINQRGQVQAIGGVNEKIEGYFALCQARGLNGRHGVIIPDSNRRHLVLEPNVVDAVRSGYFKIYSAKTVNEALEILTGMTCGEANEQAPYPQDSLFGKVTLRLGQLDRLRRAAEIRQDGAPQ